MNLTQIVGAALLAVLVFWVVGAYNRLVRLRSSIDHAFAQIDLQLQRRHELLVHLIDTARPYVEHERETLEGVIDADNQACLAAEHARVKPTDIRAVRALRVAEQSLAGTLERWMAVAEHYPELKADETLQRLGEEFAATESRLAFARQAFNEAVLAYNAAVKQFPTRLISAVFGFRTAGLLQSPGPLAPRPEGRAPF